MKGLQHTEFKNASAIKNAKDETLSVKCQLKNFELKKDATGEYCTFSGYAATFGNLDLVDDIIAPGAFSKFIAKTQKIPLLWQHNWDAPIGSITKMEEDSYGLLVEGRINMGTEKGKTAAALMRGNDIDTMSIGFRATDYEDEDGIRILKEIMLREVSVVTFPANPQAKVTSVKSLVTEAKTIREIEDILREKGGFSGKDATLIISQIKSLHHSSRDDKNDDAGRDDQLSEAAPSGEDMKLEIAKALAASLRIAPLSVPIP